MSKERKFEVMVNGHIMYVIKAKDSIEAGAMAVQKYKETGGINSSPYVSWIYEVKK